jgi:hypothetical protein
VSKFNRLRYATKEKLIALWRVKAVQPNTFEQLTPAAAQVILEQLPERIKTALINRAAEIEYPVEAVVEMAIAGYLDQEAIGFADCNLRRRKS